MTSVPWNASWSEEQRFEVRSCRWVGGRLAIWSPHLPGQGAPVFAKPHPVRQRRSIAEMRCTVCGEKTGPGYFDRWWFGVGHENVAGFAFVTTEAPLHHECALLARTICPRLKSLGLDPEPMPQWDGILNSIVGGEAVIRDYGIDVGHREVIGHSKLGWRRMPKRPL